MCSLYLQVVNADEMKINGKIYNAGYQNHTVAEIANMIKEKIHHKDIVINTEPSNDNRSYHINSDKIFKELNFKNQFTIEDAIESLCIAFDQKKLIDPLNNEMYFNIKRMQKINLK